MLHKNKSKQFLKLKYLLLIPVLVSMLVYTSCERAEPVIQEDASVKELIGELNAKMEEGKVSEDDVKLLIEFLSKTSNNNDVVSEKNQKIREAMMLYLLQKKMNPLKEAVETENYTEMENVPFAVIDKAPIFPGCENAEDPRQCFNEKLRAYAAKNFDTSIAKSLGLEPGKKKVYVQFKIDKEGNVVDVKARAPHEKIKEEAIKVVSGLPKMVAAGEKNGKKVNVTYMLPISFVVY